MSRFSRPASYLRQLFTPSSAGFQDPGVLSSDVSLIQPYDGGGWPMESSRSWVRTVTTAAIAAGAITLLVNDRETIARILAISFAVTAGVIPEVHADIIDDVSSVSISDHMVIAAVGAADEGLRLNCPILGPGHTLRGRWFGGDAATVVNFRAYLVQAPIGTVFYL